MTIKQNWLYGRKIKIVEEEDVYVQKDGDILTM